MLDFTPANDAVWPEQDGAQVTGAPGGRDAELHFRVRNLLAVVRSVFERTAATGTSLEEVARHVTGRLDAIARRQGWAAVGRASVELEDVIRDELLSVGAVDGPRLVITGPPVLLDLRRAELIGLAVHELVTNSVKFGALGGEGALSINWDVSAAEPRRVALQWAESGVRIVAAAPLRVGFGREFIEQALPYQLKADTNFVLRPGGVCCRIIFPLTNMVA